MLPLMGKIFIKALEQLWHYKHLYTIIVIIINYDQDQVPSVSCIQRFQW